LGSKSSHKPIIFANDAFLDLTGYFREEVLGQSFNFLMAGGTDRDSLALIAGNAAGGSEISQSGKDGTLFWSAILISPVRNESADIVVTLPIARMALTLISCLIASRACASMIVTGRLFAILAPRWTYTLDELPNWQRRKTSDNAGDIVRDWKPKGPLPEEANEIARGKRGNYGDD
jgi:PAS domain S-box-containing protein